MKANSVITVKLKYNFVETPCKFIIRTHEDPGFWIKSFAIINLRGVSTKSYFDSILTMQTYKELGYFSVVENTE